MILCILLEFNFPMNSGFEAGQIWLGSGSGFNCKTAPNPPLNFQNGFGFHEGYENSNR